MVPRKRRFEAEWCVCGVVWCLNERCRRILTERDGGQDRGGPRRAREFGVQVEYLVRPSVELNGNADRVEVPVIRTRVLHGVNDCSLAERGERQVSRESKSRNG